MTPPSRRPMRALPVLEGRRTALERCVYCPKLCRDACPVSNAEPRETLIPWGKMTGTWMAAHGDVAAGAATAAPAWACTSCFACQSICEHGNPVADTLLDARSAFHVQGTAPVAATRVVATFDRHRARTVRAAERLARDTGSPARAADAVLVGCAYLRAAPVEARQAISVARAVAGRDVAVLGACCGLPLRLAGDRSAFERHAATVARALDTHERVYVLDAGCALTVMRRYPREAGAPPRARIVTLVEEVARVLSPPAARMGDSGRPLEGPVRWMDPCSLGRGLGAYEAPRAVLAQALGRPPDELDESRERAICSGGGGLLPTTMPAASQRIARSRVGAHCAAGGGRLVVGCASSLLALRRAAGASIAVDDLVTWMARALAGRATDAVDARAGA